MDVVDKLFAADVNGAVDALVAELQSQDYLAVQDALKDRRRDLVGASEYAAIQLAHIYTLFRIPLGEEVLSHYIGSENNGASAVFARYARNEVHAADGKKVLFTLESRLKQAPKERVPERESALLQSELVESLFSLGGKEAQGNIRKMLPSLCSPARKQVYGILSRPTTQVYETEQWWTALNTYHAAHLEDADALAVMRRLDPQKTDRLYPKKEIENPKSSKKEDPPGYFYH